MIDLMLVLNWVGRMAVRGCGAGIWPKRANRLWVGRVAVEAGWVFLITGILLVKGAMGANMVDGAWVGRVAVEVVDAGSVFFFMRMLLVMGAVKVISRCTQEMLLKAWANQTIHSSWVEAVGVGAVLMLKVMVMPLLVRGETWRWRWCFLSNSAVAAVESVTVEIVLESVVENSDNAEMWSWAFSVMVSSILVMN